MAIGAPVVSTPDERTVSNSSASITWPAVNAGDVAILWAFAAGSVGSWVTTPTSPAFNNAVQFSNNGSTQSPEIYTASRVCDGTESGTLTVTHSAAVTTMGLVIWSGVDNTTPYDVAAVSTDQPSGTGSTTWSLTGLSPVTSGCTILYLICVNNATSSFTPPTGYTEIFDRNTGLTGNRAGELGYKQSVSTGATGAISGTQSTTARYNGIVIALRPATIVNATGTIAATEANDTLAGSGTETVSGTLARTEGADTLAATGAETVSGTLAGSEQSDTLSAAGTEAISGSLAATERADTLAATGLELVSGALSATEGNDAFAGTGAETLAGTLAAAEGNDTLAAIGVVPLTPYVELTAPPRTGTLTAPERDALIAPAVARTLTAPERDALVAPPTARTLTAPEV